MAIRTRILFNLIRKKICLHPFRGVLSAITVTLSLNLVEEGERRKHPIVVKEATEFGYETTKHGVTVYSSQRISCPDWAAGHGPTLAAYDIRPISA
ncbi:hypothetical protein DPMN_056170 [Dreissena polymorpha]|uniref:Uncharacterized protein n=1 Tax=Dreissena polymorpha TaxID=45954 RepID=A0A9D4CR79_DREPO|nr:hypothetical protein DPMN_056170 [Dreissena polymorpha]